MENIVTQLSNSDNPVIALLAFMVLILSGVIVYQWRYTMSNTVPKFIWDDLVRKVDTLLDLQTKITTILDTRIKTGKR